MKNWILAARPKTLPAAIVPVWIGSAAVLFGTTLPFSWLIFASTLIGCLCIQIATNLFNDAIDARKGADTEKRLGPKRVTASGLLSPKAVMLAALAVCAAGAVAAIPLILRHGWIPVAIGGISFILAYAYTGGPWPLAYKGLGELFVLLFFGLVAVFGTYYMQTGQLYPSPGLWVALQTGLYSTALIAINNFRDIEEDRKSGKMTLAARFGKTFARWEIGALCFVPLFLWFLLGPTGGRTVGFLAVSFLFAAYITYETFLREPSPFFNKLLALAALQLIVYAISFTLWLWR